jgi:hypothetical protein
MKYTIQHRVGGHQVTGLKSRWQCMADRPGIVGGTF